MCFGPEGPQIAGLIQQTDFSARSWILATDINIIPLNACPDVLAAIAQTIASNSAAFRQLQQLVVAMPSVQNALRSSRYSAADVVAVRLEGRVLNVYVY